MTRRVAVVIPALNEEDSLGAVLDDLQPWTADDDGRGWVVDVVIVADNGSTDGTAAIAQAGGATVVHEDRRGYGSAVQAGLRALQADPPDVVVILDADHADDPRGLQAIVGPVVRGEADLVLSDRSRTAEKGALQPAQRLGNRLATALIWGVTRRRFRDLGPFRALSWAAVERLELRDPTWGWNVEMQIKAVRRGLRVVEVPVPYRRRRAGESKISGSVRGSLRAGVRIVWAVGRYARG